MKALKVQIRKDLITKLKNKPQRDKILEDEKIWEKIKSNINYQKSKNIFVYISLNSLNEVDTKKIVDDILKDKEKNLYVPFVEKGKSMQSIKINSMNELDLGDFSLLQPKQGISDEENIKSMEEIDLIICPGLGFDKNNNRLGRGKGHYDIYLSKMVKSKERAKRNMAYLMGVCYTDQIVEKIPTEEFDIKLDLIITAD
eukprot:TRINITY_DN2879_c0_g1_i1.p1 TRINITY_DN2879_c0_g1~~TRINITY_DN2879_c0_g1_i1.p1  ORF type:complete len:199 (-),score=38.72 TRINITY_DN2879_c0_g1_i1:28-624(-)